MFITFWVPINIHCSVEYTLGHYSKQLLADMQLTSLMCGLKFKYMVYTKVEIEEYYVLLHSKCLQKFIRVLHVTLNNYQSIGHQPWWCCGPENLNISCPQQ